eukprot:g4306.t1
MCAFFDDCTNDNGERRLIFAGIRVENEEEKEAVMEVVTKTQDLAKDAVDWIHERYKSIDSSQEWNPNPDETLPPGWQKCTSRSSGKCQFAPSSADLLLCCKCPDLTLGEAKWQSYCGEDPDFKIVDTGNLCRQQEVVQFLSRAEEATEEHLMPLLWQPREKAGAVEVMLGMFVATTLRSLTTFMNSGPHAEPEFASTCPAVMCAEGATLMLIRLLGPPVPRDPLHRPRLLELTSLIAQTSFRNLTRAPTVFAVVAVSYFIAWRSHDTFLESLKKAFRRSVGAKRDAICCITSISRVKLLFEPGGRRWSLPTLHSTRSARSTPVERSRKAVGSSAQLPPLWKQLGRWLVSHPTLQCQGAGCPKAPSRPAPVFVVGGAHGPIHEQWILHFLHRAADLKLRRMIFVTAEVEWLLTCEDVRQSRQRLGHLLCVRVAHPFAKPLHDKAKFYLFPLLLSLGRGLRPGLDSFLRGSVEPQLPEKLLNVSYGVLSSDLEFGLSRMEKQAQLMQLFNATARRPHEKARPSVERSTICAAAVLLKTLELQSEEVVLRTQNCCCSSSQRRPYAQLTLLEERSLCCGTCAQINSDLAPVNDKGEGGIVPGCGCSSQLVREIVHELNLRKDGRGKVAQMRQQKFMLEKISKMAIQFPVLLTRLGVQYPPDEATLRRIFDHTPLMRPLAEDVTCCCDSLCCSSKLLELAPDEAVLTTRQHLTGSVITSRVPYGNIQSVDAMQSCGCCVALEAGELTKPPGRAEHMPIQPGFGCDRALVDTIREDMQARVDVRGNVGQIKQLEKMMAKFGDFATEIPLMLDKVGADTSYPPSQQTMSAVYGEQGPEIQPPSSLPHEAIFRQKSCCLKSVRREPYAQLGSVEPARLCFGACVNVHTDQNMVLLQSSPTTPSTQALAQEENLMLEIIKLGTKADLLSHKLSVPFPPPQEMMQSTFGGQGVPMPGELADQIMTVTVPFGLRAGDAFEVTGPNGRFQVTVPAGVVEGQSLVVRIPPPPAGDPGESEMIPFMTAS